MRRTLAFWLLVAVGALLFLLSLGVGAVAIAPHDVVPALLGRGPDAGTVAIVRDFRLARVLLVAMAGGSLAVAGTAFQGLFRNPLADPFVIGASSGAALGAAAAIASGLSATLGVPAAAFAGSLAAVTIVYLLASGASREPPAVALLLAGTAMSSLLSAAVSLLMALHMGDLHQIFFWLMGGFGGRSWPELYMSAPFALAGCLAVWLFSRPLDIIGCGEETARGLGLDVSQARLLVVGAAALATAAATAASGIVGFVGLVAPHAARLVFGPTHRRLVPAAALCGAILLMASDLAARTLLAPRELPVGVVTAFFGAPFFLYLLKKRSVGLTGE